MGKFILVLVFKFGYGTSAVVIPGQYETIAHCRQAAMAVEKGYAVLTWQCVPAPTQGE